MPTSPEEQARRFNEWANEAGIIDGCGPGGGGNMMAPAAGDDDGNNRRPQIKLPALGREYHDFAKEIGQVLSGKNVLFRRDLFAFTVNSETQRLDVMEPQRFRTWISDYIEFYVEKNVQDVTVRRSKTMTIDHAGAVLASPQFLNQLPEIRRLHFARQPVFRADGRLELLKPGFLAEQGIYTLEDNVAIDETMTIEQARENVLDFFKEYPMDDRSKAVVLASCLQMFCSALLKKGARPPSFLITANAPGAGKTILAMLPVILTMGMAAARGLPRGEELRKVLDILVIRAANYVIFDNIKSKIEADDLEAFLTTSMWQARLLGQSVEILLENNVTVFFTGNQSSWSLDMGERCLIAHLEVVEADIRDRRFSRNIDVPFIVENRGKLLSSLWASVRYWDAAGRPTPRDLVPMQRYGAWSELVPPIVIHAGFANPLRRPRIKDAEDEIDDMRELVTRLLLQGPSEATAWTFDELIEIVKEYGLFSSLFVARRRGSEAFDKDGKITPAGRSNFGKLFTRYDNRVFLIEGGRFRFLVSGRGNTRRYITEPSPHGE